MVLILCQAKLKIGKNARKLEKWNSASKKELERFGNKNKTNRPRGDWFLKTVLTWKSDGHGVRKLKLRKWLKVTDIGKDTPELRAMFKQHPQWFEVPKPKSDKGRNAVDYSV